MKLLLLLLVANVAYAAYPSSERMPRVECKIVELEPGWEAKICNQVSMKNKVCVVDYVDNNTGKVFCKKGKKNDQ